MKKGILLNSEIITEISKMGHTDKLVIADAGLPIPKDVKRIDISLIKGIPSFIETLDAVLKELKVESVIVAEEIKEKNPDIHNELLKKFSNIEIKYVSHEQFKKITESAKAVVRTGECSPYANVILESGVIF
ncbi:D-ribose pyranase [Caminicella sporogenes DSM 14501]|uniref:D-ribose pyranase n=1 Tax=Caminicella sporogenes DSM 14501 TaxID=1121266 RepID=A0A1M6PG68_9FIRM|nr:D-ribose pyranase [Caminicella sporogenes]RKD21411.1 D-ribose pyranase [Caminicella sporogenes]SHK06946.1 D-ribose pyranase [Caminicella sporogenes DSM 14501]